jgi:exopolyphosphatase/guanosine-5'-triphosphate,3'-diphosphate pyrophosphatase
VTDHVDDIIRLHPEALEVSRVVGVAGTIVTVAAVELGLAEFDGTALHGFTLSRDAAEDVFRTLATEALADRVHNPGLPRDRADVIVGGCCVLVALLRRLKVDELTVSTHNLLDGVVLEELAR